MAIRLGILAVLTGAVVLVGYAQSPSRDLPASSARLAGAGVIRGRVLAAGADTPLHNARVQIKSDAGLPAPVFTDGEGRFIMTSLAAGQYRLSATKAGYVATSFGARGFNDPGTPIAITDGDVVDGIDLRMAKAAALSGRIVDSLGDPVIGMRVTAENSAAAARGDPGYIVATTRTDDLGEYRLSGLPEGSFAVGVDVVVSPLLGPTNEPLPDNVRMTFGGRDLTDQQRTYYPGVQSFAQAQSIQLTFGDDRRSIDFVAAAAPPRTMLSVLGGRGPGRPDAVEMTYRGVIRGRVARTDGRPVARALVRTISDENPIGAATFTDEEGRFELLRLPTGTGSYRIAASKAGFLTVEYGQKRAFGPGEPIELRSGESRERLDISLPQLGSITGRVLDDIGEPVESAYMRVLQVRYESGRRRLVNVSSVGGRRTDDTGRYRLFGVPPGQYIVNALVGQIVPDQAVADLPGFAPTYFPGTADPSEAQLVAVTRSQQVSGVDFALFRVATARVAGRAVDAAGNPIRGDVILSPSRRSGSITAMAVAAAVGPDGAFEFLNVPPGDYVLQAIKPVVNPVGNPVANAFNEGEFASLFVTTSGTDVTGLVVRTSSGSTVKGRITLEGVSDADFFSAVDVSAVPVDMDRSPLVRVAPAAADIRPDLTFGLGGLSGPRLFRLTRAPRGWALKRVVLNGIDVTDDPLNFGTADQSLGNLEILLTDRISDVTGNVTDAHGRAVADATVIVFAADRLLWSQASRFLTMAKTERDGTFSVRGLPPAEYFAVAVDQVAEGGWRDPDFLDGVFPSATRVTLLEGDKVSLGLKLIAR